MSRSAGPEHRSGRHSTGTPGRGFFQRRLLFVPALVLVALAPWLVSWTRGATEAASSDPSSMIERAHSLRPAPAPGSGAAAPAGPDDADVRAVTRDVAGGAAGFDSPVSAKDAASVKTVPGPYQRLGQLQIPKIGLDVSYGEGVFDKTLVRGPGHWPGTPMPGHRGNSVVSGHRNTHTQPFKQLDELKPGDKIIVSYGTEKPTTYSITGTKIIPEAEYKDYVLRQPADPQARQITLFACHPEGNPIFRIVVQASASS